MQNVKSLTSAQLQFIVNKAKAWTADALIHTGSPETEMVIAAEELIEQGFELHDDTEQELVVDVETTYRIMETYDKFSISFFDLVLDLYTEELGGIINVNDIQWDTDGEEVDLPQNMQLMPRDIGMSAQELKEMYEEDSCLDIENYMLDVLADYLSDETGFCHEGFSIAA